MINAEGYRLTRHVGRYYVSGPYGMVERSTTTPADALAQYLCWPGPRLISLRARAIADDRQLEVAA